MNPWLVEKLMETRVADLHREAERERLGRAEPLLAARSDMKAGPVSRLRRRIGSALVRAGSRVGGFDIPPARKIRGPVSSYR
jgi:hypothetical protein